MKTLRWMMDNIYIRTDPAGNIKAGKEKNPQKKSTELLPPSWALTVRSAVETILVLLSTMTEESYSYKNGALVFNIKSSITVYLFEFMISLISRPP